MIGDRERCLKAGMDDHITSEWIILLHREILKTVISRRTSTACGSHQCYRTARQCKLRVIAPYLFAERLIWAIFWPCVPSSLVIFALYIYMMYFYDLGPCLLFVTFPFAFIHHCLYNFGILVLSCSVIENYNFAIHIPRCSGE